MGTSVSNDIDERLMRSPLGSSSNWTLGLDRLHYCLVNGIKYIQPVTDDQCSKRSKCVQRNNLMRLLRLNDMIVTVDDGTARVSRMNKPWQRDFADQELLLAPSTARIGVVVFWKLRSTDDMKMKHCHVGNPTFNRKT